MVVRDGASLAVCAPREEEARFQREGIKLSAATGHVQIRAPLWQLFALKKQTAFGLNSELGACSAERAWV